MCEANLVLKNIVVGFSCFQSQLDLNCVAKGFAKKAHNSIAMISAVSL